jgi:hypothetical protein
MWVRGELFICFCELEKKVPPARPKNVMHIGYIFELNRDHRKNVRPCDLRQLFFQP